MKKLIKSQKHGEQEILFSIEDKDIFNSLKWSIVKKKTHTMYVVGYSNGNGRETSIRFHRLVLNAKPGEIVDHVNGNGLDNRRENLRICTAKENTYNKSKEKSRIDKLSSKYKGVSKAKKDKKWVTSISKDKKRYHLGSFNCEHEAAKIYNEAAKKYYGEYAKLNKIRKEK